MRCDCHVHVVGPVDQYPQVTERTYLAGPASLETLQALGASRGIDRFVIVQPSFYGDDNSMLLDTLDQLNGKGRGVAVVEPGKVERTELTRLRAAGVRGLRANLYSPLAGKPIGTLADAIYGIEALARSIEGHIELVAPIEILAKNADLISRSSVPVVIDHYGLYGSSRPGDALGGALLAMVRSEHVWIKLSAPYRHDKGPLNIIPDPAWVKAFLEVAPDRCVWGSDWPHPPPHDTHEGPAVQSAYRPLSYSKLVDRFLESIPGNVSPDRVMSENPNRLYGF